MAVRVCISDQRVCVWGFEYLNKYSKMMDKPFIGKNMFIKSEKCAYEKRCSVSVV